jgi:hypothetical protein
MDARDQVRSMWTDAACLALITLVTALPYVTKLGFYSDDWYVLWSFHSDALQHRFGILSALHYDEARPVQGLYLALLYGVFGFHPLGYHLTNTAVIAAAMPLFYWLLVRMRVDRASAFAAAAVLVVLPQLSTVRVWYVTFQIPLSMVAALACLHCQLSFARTGRLGWAIGAAVAAIVSIAAYEIFAPLIAAFALALLVMKWREKVRGRHVVALLALVVLVGLLTLAKYALSSRPQPPDLHRYIKGLIQLVRPDYDWRTDFSLNIFAATSVHFWWPIAGWWRGAGALLTRELGLPAGAAALTAAALAFWRIRSAGAPAAGPWTDARLLLLGTAIFTLGHAVFVIVPAMSFSPTGMANRALVAAALGVALIFAAVLRYAKRLVAVQHRALAFSSAMAFVVLLGTLRILEIEKYWTEAPAVQRKVLAAARTDLMDVAPQSSVMLDGVCPYHGPAVVFEAPWDISGALSLAAGKPIHGDAVSPRMAVRGDGLATSIYGEPAFYPFGRNLYVYDPGRHRLVQLSDLVAAQRYFSEADHSRRWCPLSYVGQGELI